MKGCPLTFLPDLAAGGGGLYLGPRFLAAAANISFLPESYE